MKKCIICDIEKTNDGFYKTRNGCKACLNKRRRFKYKLSVCRFCEIEFRPDVEGRYKFCSDMCRFKAKIKIEDNGCWLWLAGKNKEGYGGFVYNREKNGKAHRASYRLFKGPIGIDDLVLHSCHTPSCVAPHHLRLGTNKDNVADKINAGRCNMPKGSQHSFSKLTEDQVREIRKLSESGESYASISRKYVVNPENISFIVRRISWKHI